ncbi:MAG: hypothetical protein M5U26_23495 [Planctomycetota bacterium]|nr:hypothetical protein [Planctomycetota bacterium]
MKLIAVLLGIVFVALAGRAAEASDAAPKLEDLEQAKSLEKDGITWTFEAPVRAGRFVNGDWYVVGPATVVKIDPAPTDERNNSVLNLPLDEYSRGASPFDSRVEQGRGEKGKKLRAKLPLALKPGDNLISSIGVEIHSLPSPLRPGDKNGSPVGSLSILTCLKEPAPADAFRPSYGDREQKLYFARDLRKALLPGLPREGIELKYDHGASFTIDDFAERYRRPWLDVCFFHFDAPAQYQVQYGREAGRSAGMAALLLCLDYTAEEKEKLLVNFVQYGIDLWGLARAGFPGWPAHGGHGTGRKLPIVFAGLLLGDDEMASPSVTYPKLKFGEDMQTMYDTGWTGAKAVYAGHVGAEGVPGKADWGKYEHLQPKDWPGRLGESYRRCCTSLAWVGQALALRILHAEKAWAHDAFFDYEDRWMSEDDSEHVKIIKETAGLDFTADWARQRQAWDPFVQQMWAKYRHNLPAAPDKSANK